MCGDGLDGFSVKQWHQACVLTHRDCHAKKQNQANNHFQQLYYLLRNTHE